MTVRKHLIDIYFYLGLLFFCLGKVIDTSFLDFYIYFNLVGLIIASYFLLSSLIYFRNIVFFIFYLGLIFFTIGNFVYISDKDLGGIFLSDLFFVFQILLKQFLIMKLLNIDNMLNGLKVIFLLDLLVLSISLYFSNYLNVYVLDLFYLVESFISLITLFYLSFFYQSSLQEISYYEKGFEIEYLLLGQFFFLIGDLFYSDLNFSNLYVLGDYSDLFFFIGFSLFLKSINTFSTSNAYNLVKSYI